MKSFGAKILCGLYVVLSVLALVVTGGGYINSYRYLEILSDYRPFFLAWGLLGLLVGLACWRITAWRRVWTIGASVYFIVIAVNGWEVLPWLIRSSEKPIATETKRIAIKTLAFNVEGGNTWFAETRDLIRKEAPDIAMFCEAVEHWSAELSELTNDFPHRVRIDAMDIELFSRHSIVRTQVFHFGEYRGFVVAGILVKGKEMTFVAAHTYARQWKGDAGFKLRNAALEEGLGTQLRAFSQPLIVMGDLNASPWSPSYKRMMRASGLHDARKGRGLMPTQHGHGKITKWLWRPIDHCLYSSDIEVQSFRTGPDLNSDHLPVIAELAFAER